MKPDMSDQLILKKLDFHGLQTLVAWARVEGWNPGPYDADAFWICDPEGFYGYFIDNELIAGGSVVSYDGDFGFMGFFIVKPAFRSMGIGRKLWFERRDLLLKRLKPNAPIGMDGVVDMQDFYRKGGFELAFRDERHMQIGAEFPPNPSVSLVAEEDIPAILQYDRQCFGFQRPRFLIPWMKIPDTVCLKYMVDNELQGFAIMRKAYDGYKICPLFADTSLEAEALCQSCLNAARGEKVFIDIPVTNPAAVNLTRKYQTTYVFECARMYYGKAPDVALGKIYGITTFELG